MTHQSPAAADAPRCDRCGQAHVRQLASGALRATCSGHRAVIEGEPAQPCRNWPQRGHRVCNQRHGARTPRQAAKAVERLEEQRARDLLERLEQPAPIQHPVFELLAVAAETKAALGIFRERLAELHDLQTTDRLGTERERAVVLLYERAVDRFSRLLVDMAKLDLQAKALSLNHDTAKRLMASITEAAHRAGLDQHEPALRSALSAVLRERFTVDPVPGQRNQP